MPRHTFGSDNHAPVHPDVLAALATVNQGHDAPYGADDVTAAAVAVVRRQLGADAEVAFVFNGTGANLVGLGLALRPWQHVICASSAHIAVDECGAPERLLGVKLVEIDTPDGKLTPDLVAASITGVGDEHRTQPGAVSITQSTELGTVYAPDEIRALADAAHDRGMILTSTAPGSPTRPPPSASRSPRRHRTAASTCSPWAARRTGSWGRRPSSSSGPASARGSRSPESSWAARVEGPLPRRAVPRAARGRSVAAECRARQRYGSPARRRRPRPPGVEITRPVQANAVFALLPPDVVPPLLERFGFYVWEERTGSPDQLVRWMCSWDTTEDDVEELVAAVRSSVAAEV
jgi:threonine aldolase